MNMFDLEKLVRPNIRTMVPYTTARDEFKGNAEIYLDANENPFGSPTLKWYNRYPDPMQRKLKQAIAAIKQISEDQVFVGNGSDESEDLLYRCFCRPGIDNVIICPPTYVMYKVLAHLNDIETREAPLTEDFQLNLAHIESLVDENTKIIWLCSPNNPTGNSLHRADMEIVLNNFKGLVVIDEAYINYARQRSFLPELMEYPNLVVSQTFSKAWGLAGIRTGLAFAQKPVIDVLNKAKPPFNINSASQELALEALENLGQVNDMIKETVDMRDALAEVLRELPIVEKVFPSDANFLLVRFRHTDKVYGMLLEKGIVVRNRNKERFCEGSMRITIGTEPENTKLVDALIEIGNSLQ